MKRIILTTNLLFILAAGAFVWQSCVKDELDFEKISGTVDYDPQLHAPLIRGSLTIADIYDAQDEDSVIVIRGDTILLYIRQDTIDEFTVSDFVEIPDQGTQHYEITSPPVDIIFPASEVYYLEQKDSFQITLEHNMRLDSLLTNTGTLVMEISSNFSSIGALRINSPALWINNEIFDTIIPFSRPSGNYYQIHNIPLTDAKIVVDNSNPDYSKLEVNFTIIQAVQAGDTIKANSNTSIDFSIRDLEDFERIFGYAGDTTFTQDTVMAVDVGDLLNGLSGEFAATNPRIHINYIHSIGIPVGFDMKITGIFEEGSPVEIIPPRQNILISEDYRHPEIASGFSFSQENIWNIDDIFVFPLPDSIGYSITVLSNPGGDENAQNYLLGDSRLLFGVDLEIPLEFRADLDFRDTFKLDIEDNEDVQYIEYANLHYRFRNEFPLEIGVKLVLLDSTDNHRVLDTILFTDQGNQLLLNAAPVDADGITIRDQVYEIPGMMELNQDQINTFFNMANKAIVIGEFKTSTLETNYGAVKILSNYKLDFKFGIETKIHYQGSIE
ncbi:MAG: hypothetical protein JW723_09540 [Bacteroidales bacterium]|nr:hypothetical protein [Bacteroidales bacterium]